MMKRICLLLFCVFAGTVYAQEGTFKGNIDTKNFPEVSFMWNEYNPDTLSVNQFIIKENGQEVKFTSKNVVPDSIPQKNRTILFLWEDQPAKKEQFDFISTLLYYFLDTDIADDASTTFNVAVFNQKQSIESPFKSKLEQFTADKKLLKTFISETVKHDETRYQQNPPKSDLLYAIKDGLDLISKEPKDNTRAIVAITSGQFIDGEKQPLINQSLKNKIPIYVVYYPTRNGESNVLTQLAKDTYGQLIAADGEEKNDSVKIVRLRKELLNIFNDLNRRHYGQDYKLTFTSLSKRDGSLSQIVVNENSPFNYNVPSFSLFIWAKEHWILFLILLVISLGGITVGVIFGLRFFREKLEDIKEQKQEEEQKHARQQAEQEAVKRKLSETQETLKRQQKAAEQEKRQLREQEQTERLSKLMRTKNLQPRLLAVRSSEMFNISNVTTTVGRSDDNDIVLSDGTVSKYHAQIVFNGTGFEICDLQSANGIILNGQYVENFELKNGDIIQLGETVIKFYV